MAQRQNLSDAIVSSILEDIRGGAVGPGDRLPTLQELAAAHDVGYGVAREAMQQLSALGIVEVRPRVGAIVRQVEASDALNDGWLAMLLSEEAIVDLYDLRTVMEVATASQAAVRATDAQIAAIRAANDAFGEAIERKDLQREAEYDVAFHAAIAVASGNSVYIKVLDALRGTLQQVRRFSVTVEGTAERAHVEHADVAKAIETRDADAAAQAMRTHLATAKSVIVTAWRQPAPGGVESTTTGSDTE